MKKLFILYGLIAGFAFSASAQTDIRKIDFKNFIYEVPSLDGERTEKIKVTNGSFSRNEEEDKFFYEITAVDYGDLDGDGRDEAVVRTLLNTGGTGNFSNGMIFTLKNGKPALLTSFEGGDRAYGGLISAIVSNGILTVERNAPGETGVACCAEFIETSRYKWNGARLLQFGKTESREIYPSERISFKKGSTMSIFRVRLEKHDRKRFVVGARKGQTLLVSSGIEPANSLSYDLRKGDGAVETTESGMIVKLNANGDYVVEIANNTDRDLEFSVTIEIN